MGIETLRRPAKRYYEERLLADSARGIDKLLFRTEDADTGASFLLDRYITSPHGVIYRTLDNQSHVRPYQNGSGTLITPPIASEKTAIPESLRDEAVAGVDATAGYGSHQVKMVTDIVQDHTEGHNMTKWKQAIDVIFSGEFNANGVSGEDLGLGINFGRDEGQAITYDFTDEKASFREAINNMVEQARATGTPLSNLCILMSQDWLSFMAEDSDFLEQMQANAANTILAQQMMPPELQNTLGLYVVGQYRGPGMIAPVWILSYSPGRQYVPYKGATATDWVPSEKAALFSLSDQTFRVYRGVTIKNEAGRAAREVGEIVFDAYAENDPVTEFLRSQSRHVFVYGNIDHTVVSTGTFPT